MMRLDGTMISLRRWVLRAVTVAALTAPASLARANDERADQSCSDVRGARDPEAAKVAFRAGQTAFSEGGYARAVEFWNQAYRDDCTAHALLLNLAMAEELLGRPGDAIHTLKLFNRRSPDSPYVEANVKRIQRLEQLAAEMARAKPAPKTAATGASVEAPPSSDSGFALKLPLVVGVAGGVAAAVGGILYLEGRSSAASVSDECGARASCADMDAVVTGERARARAEVGGWLAGGGLAALAGGLIWHVLSEPAAPADRAATGLTIRTDIPRGGIVGWSGRF